MAVRVLPFLLTALVLALPAGISTAKATPSSVWATVNVCDTAGAANTIGIRGSMPGNGKHATMMFMRFRVQYRDAKGAWKTAKSLDTGFLAIGQGNVRSRESGHSFTVKPPATGAYVLRGLLNYQWRGSHGQVTRTLTRLTTAGHKSTAGSDPPGYSKAICSIVAP